MKEDIFKGNSIVISKISIIEFLYYLKVQLELALQHHDWKRITILPNNIDDFVRSRIFYERPFEKIDQINYDINQIRQTIEIIENEVSDIKNVLLKFEKGGKNENN